VNPITTLQLLAKDLRLGPRSPVFLFAVAMPVLITVLVSAVFGNLLDPSPRLGIVDRGASQVTTAALALEGIDVAVVDDVSDLRSMVEAHELDAGVVLPAGFDEAVASGDPPPLEFFVSGSSLASTRIVLAATTLDLVTRSAGTEPGVLVTVSQLGDADFVPIGDRLLPLMVAYAVMIAGLFLPAASLVEERGSGTLGAVLVSPARLGDVLAAKGSLGAALAIAMGMVTLALNRAFAGNAGGLALALAIGSVMMAELGLLLGCWATDTNTLFTAIKGGGIVIFLPVIFVLWPGLPQWIPRLVPTYYFLQPIYEISVLGAGLGDVVVELGIAAVTCVALLVPVVAVGRRAERIVAISI
jgi:ABC-2 type transport system permease protein